jgi:hypothetical protein
MNNVNQPAFRAVTAATVGMTANTGTQTIQFQSDHTNRHVRVVNGGPSLAFVEFGNANITAGVGTGMPILPNTERTFAAPEGYVAAIVTNGTAALYFTPGEGR